MRNLKLGTKIMAAAAGMICMAGTGLHNIDVHAQEAGQYTLNDAYGVLRCALHVPGAEEAAWHDVTGDGNVTLEDVQLCLQYALKIKSPSSTDAPAPPPAQPSEDVPGTSDAPAPTGSPSDTTQPGETTEPTGTPQDPDDTSVPYISTDHITLYTGNDATGSASATITMYNVPDTISRDDIGFGFDLEYTVWLDQGSANSFWIQFADDLFTISDPVFSGNTFTYQISISEKYKDYISGTGCFGFWADDIYFEVNVAIERSHTDTTYYNIMAEYCINVGTVSENAMFSDASMCTTDAAVIIDGLNNFYGTDMEWTVPQNGTMYVTGPCVITELEVDAEKHYTVNHEKRIEEVYLETKGVYDEEMTKAVEEELKKHTGWYLGDEENCPHPKEYCDFVYDTIDSWYNGRISYRTMLYTLRYTQFYEGNKPYNTGAILDGATPEYFGFSDFSGNGNDQNCKIYVIDGAVDIKTVWQSIDELGKGFGVDDSWAGYVRVHYDSEYDTSYIYYIS